MKTAKVLAKKQKRKIKSFSSTQGWDGKTHFQEMNCEHRLDWLDTVLKEYEELRKLKTGSR